MDKKLHIVTVATHSEFYFPFLKESCKRHNSELVVLAYGDKWKGFLWRFKLVINYIKKLKHDDVVCFVDGFDVICLRNLDNMINIFYKLKNKHKCKIIVSENKLIINKYLRPIQKYFLNLYFGSCKETLINCGLYIGRVDDLLKILNDIYKDINNDSADDQMLITKYCNTYPDDIYIDINNELFLSIDYGYNEIDKYLEFNNIGVKYNNNYPFFLHGPGQTYLDNVIIKLNYNYTEKINNIILNGIPRRLYNYTILFIKNYYLNILFFILFLIFVIIIIIYLYKSNYNNKSYKKYKK